MRPVGAVVEPSIFHFFLVLARETLCYINAGFASLKPGVAAFLFGPGCSILFLKTFMAREVEEGARSEGGVFASAGGGCDCHS